MKKIINLLPGLWSKVSNVKGRGTRSNSMSDIVSKDLRQALNNPKTRYRIVDAVLARTKEEVRDRPSKSAAAASSVRPTGNGQASGKAKK